MKILLLAACPFFQERGTPIAIKLVAEVLSGAGHHLHILTYPEGEAVPIPNGIHHQDSGFAGNKKHQTRSILEEIGL